MPTISYPLEPGGPDRVTIVTDRAFRRADVFVDGEPAGTLEAGPAAAQGVPIALGGGGTLLVRLKRGFFGHDIEVLLDGRPVHVLGRRPPGRVMTAGSVLILIGLLTAVLGLIGMMGAISLIRAGRRDPILALVFVPFGVGLAFIIMGFFVRRGSFAALLVAMIFYAIDLLAMIALAVLQANLPGLAAIGLRVLVLLSLVLGVAAFVERNRLLSMWLQGKAVPPMTSK